MERKKRRKQRNGQPPTRIIVERVYLGGQTMEDAFQKINEETVVTVHSPPINHCEK